MTEHTSDFESIPRPRCEDILDMVVAVVAKNDTESNRYYDGETSTDSYLGTCARHMSEIMWVVACKSLVDKECLIEFWTKHRNFAEWGLLKPRPDGYEFLA
jgi:hypothetical protein